MAHIVIIAGSPSQTSRLSGVLGVAYQMLQESGFTVKSIAVRDLPAEDLLHAHFDSPAIKEANELIEKADAIVVASPVYKASYTGILKAFLDLLPQKGLEGKVVFPLMIGGTNAHLLAIDFALKPLLSALGAHHVLQGVYVLDNQVKWNEGGQAEIDAEVLNRLQEQLQLFIEEVEVRRH